MIKECLNEILTATFLKDIHELRKKLTVADSKAQEHQQKITDLTKLIEKLNKCHECHTLMTEYQDASTQVGQEDLQSNTKAESAPTPTPTSTSTSTSRTPTPTPRDNSNQKGKEEPELICIDSDEN